MHSGIESNTCARGHVIYLGIRLFGKPDNRENNILQVRANRHDLRSA
jgi:hypothetical protein